MRKIMISSALFIVLCLSLYSSESKLTIATWNIEHLGSPVRGTFGGGFGTGKIKKRKEPQLKAIAGHIRDEIKADVIGVQEIKLSGYKVGRPYSVQLEKIVKYLGPTWKYHLADKPTKSKKKGSEQTAFLWNSDRVKLKKIFEFKFPTFRACGDDQLFDRTPLACFFSALKNGKEMNDFFVVNLHLASGQKNYRNHLVAMATIHEELMYRIEKNKILETSSRRKHEDDIIYLGDLNDDINDYYGKRDKFGLMQYLEIRGFTNLVPSKYSHSRMNVKRSSLLDYIIISNGVKQFNPTDASILYPPFDGGEGYASYRQIYSDHFPVYIKIEISKDQ